MTSLVGMGLNNNRLTGTIPESVGMLQNLAGLRLHNNHLHGSIPNSLGNCTVLLEIAIFNNSLTGTVPANLGELKILSSIQLSLNKFTGTIPSTLSSLPALTVLALDNNAFTGNIEHLFNATVQTVLNTVQLSDNQFTGTLPEEAFALPLLLNFAAVGNCFHGSLPSNMCSARQLETLALDGLSSATSCQSAMLPALSTSYVVDQPVRGTVPSCLFALPSLQTLHLSGNGLTGSLPDNINISSSLLDLCLSHNQLTGTVPAAIQNKAWYSLDLSYNYLQGTLARNFSAQRERNVSDHLLPGTSLSLENNRFSGSLPRAVIDAPSLSVLRGNLFGCRVDRSDLPSADDNVSNYQCGSQTFDAVYFAWIALFCVVVTLGLLVLRRVRLPKCMQDIISVLQLWYTSAMIEQNEKGVILLQLQRFITLLENVVKVCAWMGAFLMLVFLPLYGLLKLPYSTHQHQYAWAASVAFQTGGVAVGLELAALIIFLTCLVLLMRRFHESVYGENRVEGSHSSRSSIVLVVYALVNVVVVVGINSAFVLITLRESSAVVSASQLALAMFKMCWNELSASGRMVTWLHRRIDPTSTVDSRDRLEHAHFLMLAVALFNTLAIPCLVVLVISPDCFYNVFVSAPSVTSQYILQQCTNAEDGEYCTNYEPYPQKTSYNPPFKYSYQCSSSFITYYTPAFVYMCLMATFGTPLLQCIALFVHHRVPSQYRCVHWILRMFLPRLLRPLPSVEAPVPTANPLGASASPELDTSPVTSAQHSSAEPSACTSSVEVTSEAVAANRRLNAHRILSSLLTYLGVLVTFGLACPPLAACVVLAVCSILVSFKLIVGRFICAATDENKLFLLNAIEEACQRVGGAEFMRRTAWLLVTFSSAFYTLFLFDTMGDAVGFQDAYWVLLVVPLVPIYVYLLEFGVLYAVHDRLNRKEDSVIECEAVEMRSKSIV